MAWRVIYISDEVAQEDDLTDSELLGLSILAAQNAADKCDVYYRAWSKIEPKINEEQNAHYG